VFMEAICFQWMNSGYGRNIFFLPFNATDCITSKAGLPADV
jgi:hypothetical protein